jgi:glucose/arabinose dehydrogenase
MRRLVPLLAVVLIAGACGKDTQQGAVSPSTPPTSSLPAPSSSESVSPSTADLRSVRVRLQKVAGLDGGPLAMAVRQGDTALFVAEQVGRVMAIRDGQVEGTPVLDVTSRVTSGGEQGLLGLAFSPDGRFLYVNYTDGRGDTNVVEYAMNGNVADAGSARRVLLIDQPFSNHNGGNLVFGPDGYLYIGMGDGGSQGDPNHNGQNLDARLAKMLRIDPRPSGGRPYGIPPDNPFVNRPGARPEVWDYGLRNPWRYSFDRQTGDLWIGDVGGSEREEIDFEREGSKGGRNYGWNLMEGTVRQTENLPPGLVTPIYEYETGSDGTCAIIGGYVYRGAAIPSLQGVYLFSDNCGAKIRALRVRGGKVVQQRALGLEVGGIASFGQDQDGELYALSLAGGVYKILPA